MFKSKLVLRTALLVMVMLSFAIGGGRAFADTTSPTTDTTGNTVAADNTANQSAAAGPATVSADPAANNDQSNVTPDSGTPPPPADTTTSTDTTGSQQTPPAPMPPVCVPPDATAAPDPSNPDPSAAGQANSTANLGIDNNICSAANSGNASVTGNGSGGNATTGNADSEATILNIIQSITGLSGSQLATFVQNIGSGTGDITLDPALLQFLAGGGCTLCSGSGLNSNVNSTINNNINLSANSGSADVSNNGSGGNATSGDATALLNLINIINSIIASNKAFIGIININGDLNGDILLPPEWLNSLLGSNAPPTSGSSGGSSQLNSNNTQGINNNVNLSANSGNADVSGNDSGGNATTGNSLTKLTLMNLTGSEIIGQNALLVFINVLGNWIGMIVNAPAGATSATLGNATSSGATPGLDVNSTTNSQINNNINLSAATGNASVTGNGSGGNATSGNATASANIINIINSDISLTGWFGILFINVLGNWTGSFGIDTSAGDPPATPPSDNSGNSGQGAAVTTAVAHISGGAGSGAGGTVTPNDTDTNQTNNVLGAFTGSGSGPSTDAATSGPSLMVGLIGGLLCFFLLGAVERRQGKNDKRIIPVVQAPELLTNQWQ